MRELFFPLDAYYWMERDPINHLGGLENNLSESNSEKQSNLEVKYHRVSADEEWGGVILEKDPSDVDHYIVSEEEEIELKSNGERVDGILSINMDLIDLPPFSTD